MTLLSDWGMPPIMHRTRSESESRFQRWLFSSFRESWGVAPGFNMSAAPSALRHRREKEIESSAGAPGCYNSKVLSAYSPFRGDDWGEGKLFLLSQIAIQCVNW